MAKKPKPRVIEFVEYKAREVLKYPPRLTPAQQAEVDSKNRVRMSHYPKAKKSNGLGIVVGLYVD